MTSVKILILNASELKAVITINKINTRGPQMVPCSSSEYSNYILWDDLTLDSTYQEFYNVLNTITPFSERTYQTIII